MVQTNINWEKFYERFKWQIKDGRSGRWKYLDEDIPNRYYTLNLKELIQPAYTKCYKTYHNQCMYMSKDGCNCINKDIIGDNIKCKSLNKIKVKDCSIICERMHNKNVYEYLNSIVMPFGKFKGKTIASIIEESEQNEWDNLYYLFWLWQQGWCKGELKKALDVVRVEYDNRWKGYIHPTIGSNFSPWDDCPFSLYNEVGYGELC